MVGVRSEIVGAECLPALLGKTVPLGMRVPRDAREGLVPAPRAELSKNLLIPTGVL